MKLIRMGRGLSFSAEEAVTQRFAFIARPDAGKTHTAKLLEEGLVRCGQRVIVFDPVGVHWGLRLGRDGKSRGLDVLVLGGKHGALPLVPTAGVEVANFVQDNSGTSIVLDMKLMTRSERRKFTAAFVEQFYERQKHAEPPTPTMLVFEEAQRFIPQITSRGTGDEHMVGIIEEIADQGRNDGIGIAIITLRPEKVAKNVLNLTEVLCVGQLTGPHEIKAVQGWIREQGVKVAVDGLPKLQQGHFVVWSPGWLKMFETVLMNDITTFHSSATPKRGERRPNEKLVTPSKSDIEKLRKAMGESLKLTESNDPKTLRAEIRRLEEELAMAKKAKPAKGGIVKVTVPVLSVKERRFITKLMDTVDRTGKVLNRALNELQPQMANVRALTNRLSSFDGISLSKLPAESAFGDASVTVETLPRGSVRPGFECPGFEFAPPPAPKAPKPAAGPVPPGGPKKGARELLAAIATFGGKGADPTTVAIMVGIKPKGSTFYTYFADLKRRGYIEETTDGVVATRQGVNALGDSAPTTPSTYEEVRALWDPKLKAGARAMLDAIVAAYPKPLSGEQVAAGASRQTGKTLTVKGSTYYTYTALLKRFGLVEEANGYFRASANLFPGARREHG